MTDQRPAAEVADVIAATLCTTSDIDFDALLDAVFDAAPRVQTTDDHIANFSGAGMDVRECALADAVLRALEFPDVADDRHGLAFAAMSMLETAARCAACSGYDGEVWVQGARLAR